MWSGMRRSTPAVAFAALVSMVPAALADTDAVIIDSRVPAQLSPVVVTADPIGDRTADDLVQPVSVLQGAELDRRRAGTLGEILDGLPGVANADFGPGVGRPVIRGLQGSRVKVLEDGLGAADVSGEGADHAIAIDPLHAEQIEVFRGPTMLLYGSGAAGGVVNVRSRRFASDFVPATKVNADLSFGWNGDDRQGRFAFEHPLSNDFVLRGDYGIRRSNDFDIDGFQGVDQTGGRRDRLVNSSINTDSGSVTGLFRQDWGFVGLGVSRWRSDYGIPENFDPRPRDEGGQDDEFERILAEYDRVDLRGEVVDPLPGFSVARLKLARTIFEQEEVEFEFERTSGGGVFDESVVEAEFENRETEARLEMVHLPLGSLRGVVGLQVTDRDFFADDPRGDERGFYVRPNRTRSLALFAVEEMPTDFGRLEFGARVERTRSEADAVFDSLVGDVTTADGVVSFQERIERRNFTPFSVSAGTIIDVGELHHLRVAISRSQRAPSAEQLYAFGRHAAAGTFEVGNPDLDKESYTNIELGFDRHIGPLRYDLTLFYNRADDFIFLQSEDDGAGAPVEVDDVGRRADEEPLRDPRNVLVTNEQDDAEFYGAEFIASADVITGAIPLTLRASGDYVRGRLRGDGGDLPRITPARLGVGLDTGWKRLRVSADYRRVFKQSRTGTAEDESDGFNLLSMDLSYRTRAQGVGATLFLQGRNLLDEDGRLHQSFFRNDAPIIGRAFIAGVRMELGG